jgi:threonine dehydratase
MDTGATVGLDDVRAAADRIAGRVVDTPCLRSDTLSAIAGTEVWLKFENLQYTASFKERGALNRLLLLSPEERARGVIAASAGNHAQGVARHATLLGVPSVIVMPQITPFTKVAGTRRLGAEVIQAGGDFDAAYAAMREIAAQRGMTEIHPFDDPGVIAGQGTVALEMLRQAPELDTLVVPVGGGGLMSGMATAAKALRPDMRVIGVQSALYAPLASGSAAGGSTLAEGIAVKRPGRLTSAILGRLGDGFVTVDEQALEHAVALLADLEKTVAEGAGAAALAAVLSQPARFRRRRLGLVISGGNIDTRLLASVLLRDLARQGRIVRVRADVADSPGSLARVAGLIAEGGGNIIEVEHQRLFGTHAAKSTEIEFTVETVDAAHARALRDRLTGEGIVIEMMAERRG